jgi:uncharacterized membrane protein
MKEAKPSFSRNTLVVVLLLWAFMAWVGYQMRGIEEGERQMDEAAERYFEEVDSIRNSQ